MNFILCFLAILSIAFAKDFDCNMHNNDCLGCIQAVNSASVHSCSYCPVDGKSVNVAMLDIIIIFNFLICIHSAICHTVGSLFNKCSSSECVSLCATSSCEMKTADDCNIMKPYGKHLR
jgi:hypothetical protein